MSAEVASLEAESHLKCCCLHPDKEIHLGGSVKDERSIHLKGLEEVLKQHVEKKRGG